MIQSKNRLFDRPDSEIQGKIKRYNENLWFKQQQNLLLWMANTDYGRDLLNIPKWYPHVLEIQKNNVKTLLGFEDGKMKIMADFRVGAKWSNIIRYRWAEFQEYAQYFYASRSSFARPILFPVAQVPNYAYLTLTAYPDPDVETTTVDGRTFWQGDAVWSTARTSAGTGASDTVAAAGSANIVTFTTSSNWDTIIRFIALFDTSSIGDSDTIDSATFSLFGSSVTDTGFNQAARMVDSNPASNTAVGAGDYYRNSLPIGGGALQSATSIDLGVWSTSAYNDFTLDATGLASISKTGVSKFGMMLTNDQSGTEPTWASNVGASAGCKHADTAGTTNDPKLVVQYTAAAGAATPKRLLALFGLGQ
jgi:hypothetical protein